MERRFSQTMASKWQTAFVVCHKIPWRAVPCSLPSRITTKVLKNCKTFSPRPRLRPNAQDQYFHFCPRDQDPGLEDYDQAHDDLSPANVSCCQSPTKHKQRPAPRLTTQEHHFVSLCFWLSRHINELITSRINDKYTWHSVHVTVTWQHTSSQAQQISIKNTSMTSSLTATLHTSNR